MSADSLLTAFPPAHPSVDPIRGIPDPHSTLTRAGAAAGAAETAALFAANISDIAGASNLTGISTSASAQVASFALQIVRGLLAFITGGLLTLNSARYTYKSIKMKDPEGVALHTIGTVAGATFASFGAVLTASGSLGIAGKAAQATSLVNSVVAPLFLSTCGIFLIKSSLQSREITNFRNEMFEQDNVIEWIKSQMEPTPKELSEIDASLSTIESVDTRVDQTAKELEISNLKKKKLHRLVRILGEEGTKALLSKDLNQIDGKTLVNDLHKASYIERVKARFMMAVCAIGIGLAVAIFFSSLITSPAMIAIAMTALSALFFLFLDSPIKNYFAELFYRLFSGPIHELKPNALLAT